MENKQCNKCGEIKEVRFFPRNKSTKDGYATICKKCTTARTGTKADKKRNNPYFDF